jgi:predicted DNA-binding mobile mystery protein A
MERAEAHGNITLRTLRRAAEAMECELVYALVPKVSLESTLRKQAVSAARHKLAPVDHTMRLEEQGLASEENSRQIAGLSETWMDAPPRWLWDIR